MRVFIRNYLRGQDIRDDLWEGNAMTTAREHLMIYASKECQS